MHNDHSERTRNRFVKVQCLVIGAGPGGYAAAFRASDLGMQVTLIERYKTLGGVCLNVGCIPSKALLHVAELINAHDDYHHFGLSASKPETSTEKLLAYKDKLVGKLTGGLNMLAKKRKVNVLHGQAHFEDENTVTLIDDAGNKQRITFEHCILATGSRPVELGFLPSHQHIVDSTGALELPVQQGKLLIIGGGIIGCEMATVYQALGMQVTICEMLDQIMPGADSDLVKPCHKHMESRGITILTQTKVQEVKVKGDDLQVKVTLADGSESKETYQMILQAVGRRSNADQMHCEAAGICLDEHGFVKVHPQNLQTSNPKVRAIGDIVGGHMLAHKATAQGRVAAEMVAGEQVIYDVRVMPSVAYTELEVAWVGLTEVDAKKDGITYEKGVFPWAANGRALCLGQDKGFTKLLYDPKTHRVLGGGIVGKNAGDLIAELGLAIEMGSDVADIALTVHPHPTLVETIGLAAEVAEKTVTDL